MRALFFVLGLGLSILLISFTNTTADGYKVGDTGSDFSLMSTSGEMVSLANYENAKGYILIFTCNSCPYSVMYEDRIIELHNKWADKGYPVIAINPNDPNIKPADSYDKMKVRAEKKSFPFPYLFDDGQEVFPVYGATRTPHVFVLDQNMVVQYIGAIDDNARSAGSAKINYVDNAIDALDKGSQPDPSFTKAIGCSIKYQS